MSKARQMNTTYAALVILSAQVMCVEGFSIAQKAMNFKRLTLKLSVSTRSWSAGDDWTRLSDMDNIAPESDDIFNSDIARKAANEIDSGQKVHQQSNDDAIIARMMDVVHHHGWYVEPEAGDPALYDSNAEELTKMSFEDEMGREIAMLVRCNQLPEDMLISEGRALAPLSKEQLNDISQLMTEKEDKSYEQTEFFRTAVSFMFNEHSHFDNTAEIFIMDAMGTTQWLAKSIGKNEEPVIRPHDRLVAATISRFSNYGTGYLTEENFQQLYRSAFMSTIDGSRLKNKKKWNVKQPTVDTIWRDIRNHDIISPVEMERANRLAAIRMKYGTAIGFDAPQDMNSMDECEIIDVDYDTKPQWEKKSSHELIALASDGKTPLWMRDGEFIFIDEESCIGCKQCAHASPDSFMLLDNGRARTFQQRNTPDVAMGVEACPVNCMHPVSFEELREMETARDHGDGRTDHRHFGDGRAHTALNVAGIGSDANHKSSWFHYLKNKCYMSKSCPQRGCFNCPNYSSPGQNPYFQAKHQDAEHQRASEFIENGTAEPFRKTFEL